MAFRINAPRRLMSDNSGNAQMVHTPVLNTQSNEQKLSTVNNQGITTSVPIDYSQHMKTLQETYANLDSIKPLDFKSFKPTPLNIDPNMAKNIEGGVSNARTLFSANKAGRIAGREAGRATYNEVYDKSIAGATADGSSAKQAHQIARSAAGVAGRNERISVRQANKGGFNAGATGAVIGAAGSFLGAVATSKGREDIGGILKGAGQGASLGSMAGPVGLIVGTVAGAVIGGVMGQRARVRRIRSEKQENKDIATYNSELESYKNIEKARAGELQRNTQFRNNATTQYFYQGGKLELPSLKLETALILEPLISGKRLLLFKKGGAVDFTKGNVILDGPSHDEINNTSVKGDKGLPIVKEQIKVAEIESHELVLNIEAMRKIDKLRARVKMGDTAAIKELGQELLKELTENTYDYRDLEK